jgi:hypothetical protein
MTKRKTRTDRNHAIYQITNIVTGEQYIGVTVCSGSVKKALKVRIQKHIRRALTENKTWALCKSIREHGVEAFEYGLLEIVRGKAPAHARERELTAKIQPELNTL